MRVICTVSHEVPQENGKFDRYIAGREYEVAEPDMSKFRAAGGSSDDKTQRAEGREHGAKKKKRL